MRAYYKACHCILFVYDVADRSSFEAINNWDQDLKEVIDTEKTVVMLVGNKVDKEDDRKVTEAEGAELAKSLGIDFIETSAKLGLNIHEMFMKITEKMLSKGQGSKFLHL